MSALVAEAFDNAALPEHIKIPLVIENTKNGEIWAGSFLYIFQMAGKEQIVFEKSSFFKREYNLQGNKFVNTKIECISRLQDYENLPGFSVDFGAITLPQKLQTQVMELQPFPGLFLAEELFSYFEEKNISGYNKTFGSIRFEKE